jgi:hypothetical protein
VSPGAPSDALLPVGGILSLAAQLIATSGETPLIAQAWLEAVGVQPNGYNLDAMWADPISGKGWAMYDDNISLSSATNHYWITAFTWPTTTTDYTVVQHALQSAIVDAVARTRARTSVDDFGRRATGPGLSGIESLVWDAAYKGANSSVVTVVANREVLSQAPIYTPGHAVKLIEMWATVDRTISPAGQGEQRVHGTYLMSVDGTRSTHAFCFANALDISFDFGVRAAIDLMHTAEKSLGLPLDPATQSINVGDTLELVTCSGPVPLP